MVRLLEQRRHNCSSSNWLWHTEHQHWVVEGYQRNVTPGNNNELQVVFVRDNRVPGQFWTSPGGGVNSHQRWQWVVQRFNSGQLSDVITVSQDNTDSLYHSREYEPPPAVMIESHFSSSYIFYQPWCYESWVRFNTGEDGVVHASLLQWFNRLNNGAVFDLSKLSWVTTSGLCMLTSSTVTNLGDNTRTRAEVGTWH